MARTVGELIADARSSVKGRGRHGMSQADLIEAMGLPRSARSWLAQVETGRTLKPDPERLRMIADVLGTVTYRELLAASDQLDALTGGTVPEPVAAPAPAGDLSALLLAMERQSADQRALIAQLVEQNRLLTRLLGLAPESIPTGADAGPLPRQGLARGVRTLAAMESALASEAAPASEPDSGATPRGAR